MTQNSASTAENVSKARAQRCLYCGQTYPLYPPITDGCPTCATDSFKSPLEIVYDHIPGSWLPENLLPGLERYAPMLPPLAPHVSMGEGGTPLVQHPPHHLGSEFGETELYIKDESRNPTWSHKDRLNLCVISTALNIDAPGIVAASSGNHGAAAAAYAARAGLPAVILCTPRPPAVASFLQAYGQVTVAVPDVKTRWSLMQQIIDEWGYHPASNYTTPPTNHPVGSEGYKTIAYEIYLQLGRRAPEAIFVPVSYAEITFGIYKGFYELQQWGRIESMPRIIACEPAAGAPLKKAIQQSKPIVEVSVSASDAYAIAVPVNSYRGVVAVGGSNGMVLAITEEEMKNAQHRLGQAGIWAEASSAISFAGALHAPRLGLGRRGPLVCINTSSGFKDNHVGEQAIPLIDGSWSAFLEQAEQQREA